MGSTEQEVSIRTTFLLRGLRGGEEEQSIYTSTAVTSAQKDARANLTLINTHMKIHSSYLMQTMEYACFAFLQRWPTSRTQKDSFNKEFLIGDKSYSTKPTPQPHSAPQHCMGTPGSELVHRKGQFP